MRVALGNYRRDRDAAPFQKQAAIDLMIEVEIVSTLNLS